MSMLEHKLPTTSARSHLVARDLVSAGPTLHATDGLAKAMRHFAEVGLGVLPVVEGERMLGVLVEADALDWLADRGYSAHASDDVMVLHLMRAPAAVAYADEPLEGVMPLFEQRRLRAVPVLDALDRYRGLLTRAAVLTALTSGLRPATVGGMATPFGVYLTTGNVQAGVGFWGLFACGVVLALANGLIEGLLYLAQLKTGVTLPEWGEALLAFGLFLVALRLSPMAGTHAAEHQTVNAIERGEPLDLETIAGMPREHPRCGTNLMALLFGLQLLLPLIAHEPWLTLPLAVAGWLTWRRVGALLQRFFTTKPPRGSQLLDGQRAGEALLAAYAQRPAYQADRFRRVWNLGVVQVLAGAVTTLAAMEAAYRFWPAARGPLL